jgi:hypothetical protein
MTILRNVRLNGTVNFTPSPVFAGLQIYYDAGKTSSYPGSGLTWFDISGNGRNATMTATTYTPTAGGGLNFVAANSARGTSPTFNWNANAFTMSVWIYPTTVDLTVRRFLSIQGASPNFYNWAVSRLDGGNASGQYHGYLTYGAGTILPGRVNGSVVNNTYQNYVTMYDGASLTSYKNNSLISTVGGAVSLAYSPTGNNLFITSPGELFDGNMYVVMLYNRALTAAERTQNYDAFRGRFGL